MQISTTARNCEIDAPTRQFAQRRLEKLGRLARDIREARLIVTTEKYRHNAEITLALNQHEMVSRQTSDEMRVAIDLAAAQLEHQLRRLKERRVDQHRTGPGAGERARREDAAAPEAEGAAPEGVED